MRDAPFGASRIDINPLLRIFDIMLATQALDMALAVQVLDMLTA